MALVGVKAQREHDLTLLRPASPGHRDEKRKRCSLDWADRERGPSNLEALLSKHSSAGWVPVAACHFRYW